MKKISLIDIDVIKVEPNNKEIYLKDYMYGINIKEGKITCQKVKNIRK